VKKVNWDLIVRRAPFVALTALLVALAGLAFMLWPSAPRVNKIAALLADCNWYDKINKRWRGNPGCLQTNVLSFTGSVRAVEKTVLQALPDIATSARLAANNSADASKHTAEAAKKAGDLIDAGTAVVKNLDGAVTDLRAYAKDLHNAMGGLEAPARAMLADSDQAVKDAGAALVQLADLEKELKRVVGLDNEKALEIAQAMLDRIQDKDVTVLLENLNHATASGSEILKSVDMATRWMREKVALVKTILNRILGLIKVTVPLW
jgi:hypothetical protein